MKKLVVAVTREIPDEGLALLRKDKRLSVKVYGEDRAIPRKELLRFVKGADIILSILTERMDKEAFDAAGPQLKMVANYAVGFDNIDLKEAAKRGLVVTNAAHPNVSETVAEHAIALMFALAHRVVEVDAFTRAGKYRAWGPKMFLGTDMIGKTIGVVGAGAIGQAIVRRLYDGFGMDVLYADMKRNPTLEARSKARFVTLPELLKKSDFVSLHVPLLPSTRHLIGAKELKMMKKTAFLINTARGPVVDEKALLAALTKGEIAGAGLDVYECEPAIDCDLTDTLELRKMRNVVLTPHTASATVETRQAMSRTAAENILAFVNGKKPPNMVKT
ncbi:D-glycerate dehydrogenase [Patescibacteria group bacterium]|nr:MAG: D-glycerate dehydrogenase [Patescibacteria group bacterium]